MKMKEKMEVMINVQEGYDFAVVDVNVSENVVIGDIVKINATIAMNATNRIKPVFTSVEFLDGKDIKLKRSVYDYYGIGKIRDVITISGASKMRVHFSYIRAYSNIRIYDNNSLVEEIKGINEDVNDYWTEWCDGDTVHIESSCSEFEIDRYEALLASMQISLNSSYTNCYAMLNLSMQEMGWILNGTHDITVKVDPYDEIDEINEENNMNTKRLTVRPSVDFAVTNIYPNPQEPLLGDIVVINATIANYGVRKGTTSVEVYYDNNTVGLERRISGVGNSSDTISLPTDVAGARLHFAHVSMGTHCSITIYDGDGNEQQRITEEGWTDYRRLD